MTAIIVILILMIGAYVLTFLVPGGSYTWVENENGNLVIDTAAPFQAVKGGLPFYMWVLSPLLVLGADGGGTLVTVIIPTAQ